MTDGWFPRYSQTGLMRGSKVVTINDRFIGDGISGAWLDERTALFKGRNDGLFEVMPPYYTPVQIGPGVNHVDARGGLWVGAVDGKVICSDGREWQGFGGGDSGCAVGVSGDILLLKHDDGSVWRVRSHQIEPEYLAPLGANIRACDDMFVWKAGNHIQGWNLLHPFRLDDLTVDSPEFWPVPFRVDHEYWVLTHTQTRCIIRPWGSTFGYVVAKGETFYPDAIYVDNHIAVAWSSSTGLPCERAIDPASERTLLTRPEERWLPTGTVVDVLPYIVPDDIGSTTPRILSGDNLTPAMQTWRDGLKGFVRVKWGRAEAIEGYIWDDEFVRLAFDATDGRGLDRAWRVWPNMWAKRLSHVGDLLRVDDAVFIRKGEDHTSPCPYGVRVHAVGDGVDLGGAIGYARVLILASIPFIGQTADQYEERHWFAMSMDSTQRYGLVRYEEFRNGQIVADRSASFTCIISTGGVRPAPSPVIPIPEPPPVEDLMKSRDQFYAEFKEVNTFYAAEEGLKRPGGMVLGDGSCDVEAMGAWGYDLLALDKTPGQCKTAITHSQEWADKHPGEPPPSFT